ncbi:phosphatidylserine decarboxylase [Streptomyces sp. XD-27]|uniref:phosphatidylserine decarboxylase n=1 Tax=Streptomyces sp. XD-27 TaxID=3062779 RepID=UPI0026F45BEE|nr:phosphatidylserine decarboxylase [Streptomyces sp. XD-27]WKX69322.1 phosphatidylserine decarboxylase [Streptomyces sp. XD-27]
MTVPTSRRGIIVKTLEAWIDSDVRPLQDKPLSWLSENHFFRDPVRATFIDDTYFFSPADGIVLYQKEVKADADLLDIKGRSYTLRHALRDPFYDKHSLVVGIFMTFFDVHVNRIPFSGRLSYRALSPIRTYNLPMLPTERTILDDLRIDTRKASYLHHNQRVVNRIDAPTLGRSYYVLQVAEYDINAITPFGLEQNCQFTQGQRFSQIRFGSQVDLIVPLSGEWDFTPVIPTGCHVEAGLDPLIKIRRTTRATA